MTAIEEGGLAYHLEDHDALDFAVILRNRLLSSSLRNPKVKDIEHILRIVEFNEIISQLRLSKTEEAQILENIDLLKTDLLRLETSTSQFSEKTDLKALLKRLSGKDAVQVMSGHASKGREFSIVFLIGMEDDSLPSYRTHKNSEDLAEERRIFYVALTRAKQSIYMSCARQRKVKGTTYTKKLSRFIGSIPEKYFSPIDLL